MITALIKTTRPAFLILTFSVVALAAALALHHGFAVSPLLLGLVLLSAVSAHAAVNVLNEVHDARSGLDELTQRTPFSGGSGALQEAPHAIRKASLLGRLLIAIVVACGLYFIYLRGWALVPIGLIGLVLVVAYTPLLTHRPFLCLIAPGIGFGPLMVVGSYFVLIGHYSGVVFAVSLIPFFLVSNLLLLNQFPDAQADVKVGRKNLLTAYGSAIAVNTFISFLVAAFATLLLLVAFSKLPPSTLFGLLVLVVALPLVAGVMRLAKEQKISHRLLGLNVAVAIGLPLLIAVGLSLG